MAQEVANIEEDAQVELNQIPVLIDDEQDHVQADVIHHRMEQSSRLVLQAERAAIREQLSRLVFVRTTTYCSLVLGIMLAIAIRLQDDEPTFLIIAAVFTYLITFAVITYAKHTSEDYSTDIMNFQQMCSLAFLIWTDCIFHVNTIPPQMPPAVFLFLQTVDIAVHCTAILGPSWNLLIITQRIFGGHHAQFDIHQEIMTSFVSGTITFLVFFIYLEVISALIALQRLLFVFTK